MNLPRVIIRPPAYSRDSLARQSAPIQAAPNDATLSPSLRIAAGPKLPAFEVKFQLTEEKAAAVERFVRTRLSLDPHADATFNHQYRTTTLYCDTADFDVFYHEGPFKREKHRLRRYGHDENLFLERKYRRADRVKKRRSIIPEEELPLVFSAEMADDWDAAWFRDEILEGTLRPACRISYDRRAYFGEIDAAPLRFTFDRNIRGITTTDWNVDPFEGGTRLSEKFVVCEMKFQNEMPSFFKDLARDLAVEPGRFSKYRAFMHTVLILK